MDQLSCGLKFIVGPGLNLVECYLPKDHSLAWHEFIHPMDNVLYATDVFQMRNKASLAGKCWKVIGLYEDE